MCEPTQLCQTSPQCQICFDDIPQPDNVVTQLCGPKCPAVLCRSCLVNHLSVALQVGYVGALPRVRCPLCLVPLHKSQWSTHVRAEGTTTTDGQKHVLKEYTRLCHVACSFQTPCCHNPDYVHLPNEGESRACKLPLSQLQALQKKCRQFGRHRISPRDLIAYIEASFPDQSERVFEAVLDRITDDERQATLMLSYHAVKRVVVTSCCGWLTCFNCKRSLPRDGMCACEEEEEIDEENDIVQCRSCRAMLVKVEGCDTVQCMCGFPMDWAEELNYRWRMKCQLLAVDPFDTTVFGKWVEWRRQLLEMFASAWNQGRVKVQLKMLAKSHPAFTAVLRQFVWRHRITRVCRTPAFVAAVHAKYADRVLVPLLRPVVRAFLMRRREAKAEAEQRRVERQRFVDAMIVRHKVVLAGFASAVLAVTRARQKAALKALRKEFLSDVYNGFDMEQQAALADEERAFESSLTVALAA